MSSHTVLVIGGGGAQGAAVVKALATDPKYAIRVLTRNPNSPSAKELSLLPNVFIVVGDTYHEPTLKTALAGVDSTYVNTNGFAIGEKAEIYWGIRIYELAREAKVKHFIWASLFYGYKFNDFDPKFRSGHLDGKGKVADFLTSQPTTPMRWSILTSAPYIEMLTEMLLPDPSPTDPETAVFYLPLGHGEAPLIHLEDLGFYAKWMLDMPEKSNGLNLAISTQHVGWDYLAKTFTEVTGKRAVYQDITLDQYFSSPHWTNPDGKVGHIDGREDDDTLQTYRQNFSGFWNTWKAMGGAQGYGIWNYNVLDEILPGRVKTLGEWMKKTSYTGDYAPVLKGFVGLQ